jgi:hypothetical protein
MLRRDAVGSSPGGRATRKADRGQKDDLQGVTYGYDKVIDLDVKSYFDTIGTWSNGACAMRACCG